MDTDLRAASSERQPAEPVRLLVATTPLPAQRLADVLSALLDSGVELVFSVAPESLPEAIRAHPRATSAEPPLTRTGSEAEAVALLRAAADLVRFLNPDLEGGRWPRKRTLRRLLDLTGIPNSRPLREAAERRLPAAVATALGSALREVERLLPPPRELEGGVAGIGVDGVLILSRCSLGGPEPDVIKAARKLGLPSIMLLVSWDNLASKALLNEHPDLLLVWNEVQVREAVDLHGVPAERVVALGASNFDRFFQEMSGHEPHEGDATATILYLGSSPKVAPNEPAVVERWVRALRASDDPAVRGARVVVRPHPVAAGRWEGWRPPDAGVGVVQPGARAEPAKLSQLLREADAVVALNTSAEIEAAISGCPVLTFRAGPAARGQEGSVHFPYLLEASGGFVIDAPTLEEHVARLAQVLHGGHDPEPMRRFVEYFVRPRGISRPVVPLVASAITDFARRSDPSGHKPSPLPSSPSTGRSNRVLVLSPPALLSTISDVLTELLDSGLELVFSGKDLEKLKLPEELLVHPCSSAVTLPLQRGGDAGQGVATLRTMADLTRFLSPDVDEEGREGRVRVARRLLKLLKADYQALAPEAASLLLPREAHRRVASAFRELERLLPPPPGLEDAIEQLGIAAVLLVTRCTVGGFEPDIVKAARRLGIPSLMLVASWDNLTSKALVNEHPDRLIVWNEVQVAEAVELHGISPERVLALGAPCFDRFFAEVRAQAAEHAPIRNGRRTILYLGSSPDVTPDEPAIFERWLGALRSSSDPVLHGAGVAVRPHPGARKWGGWTPADERVHLLIPRGKRDPGTLAQLLASADAVVALNTSAEIEAAIAGRPVVTFRAGRDAPGQEGTLHFPYLLRDNGGFVIDSATLADHVTKLGRVLRGDYDSASIRRFVERFVRPGGLTQPVSPVVASAILQLVRRESATVAESDADASREQRLRR